jgi:hypothetical protein
MWWEIFFLYSEIWGEFGELNKTLLGVLDPLITELMYIEIWAKVHSQANNKMLRSEYRIRVSTSACKLWVEF